MSKLRSATWWKAAANRAMRTALVIAIPYVPVTFVGDVPYVTIASAAALGGILSLLTSLTGIAEVDGTTEPWYYAILSRVVKTVAQAVIAGAGTAVLITDVDWSNIGQMALTAGFGSLLLAVLSQLPEADLPTAAQPAVIENTTMIFTGPDAPPGDLDAVVTASEGGDIPPRHSN